MASVNIDSTSAAATNPPSSIIMTQEQEEKTAEVSFESDEDEYEYTYVDSDMEEEETQQQLCGVKRNASPSFPLKEHATRAAGTANSSSTQQSSIRRQDTCPYCNEETHLPVTDCTIIQKWRQTQVSNGILVVNSKLLVPAMKRRIRDCALQLMGDISQSEASIRLVQNHWNIQTAHNAMMDEQPPLGATANNNMANVLLHRGDDDDVDDFEFQAMMMDANEFFGASRQEDNAMFMNSTATVDGRSEEQEDAKPAAIRQGSVQQDAAYETSDKRRETPATAAVPAVVQPPNALDSRDENRARKPCRGNEMDDEDDDEDDDDALEEEDSKPPAVGQGPSAAPPAKDTTVQQQQCCPICMGDYDNLAEEDMMSLSCSHKFCRDCFSQYIEHTFNNAVLPDEYLQATCPIPGCDTVVTEVEIQQVTPHLLPEYQNRQLHSFVDGNRETMRWCVGPDCKDQVAVKCREGLFPRRGDNANVSFVTCDDCQTQFCFRCGQAPHDEVCQPDRAPVSSDSKNKPVKNCPKCNIKIEKNGGCNHMRCKCGCHFCWICLEADTDYSHFCGRERGDGNNDVPDLARHRQRAVINDPVNLDYITTALQDEFNSPDEMDDEDVARVLQEKKEMDRRAHYMTRFIAHEEGQRFATDQCDLLLEGRAVDFAKASDLRSATDTDFLKVANETLVSARRMLKWSYCYVYYLPDDDTEGLTSQKGLFQNHQERLERFTENLSDISEHALFYDDRAKIVNLMGVIDQCMNIITEFEEFGAKYAAPK